MVFSVQKNIKNGCCGSLCGRSWFKTLVCWSIRSFSVKPLGCFSRVWALLAHDCCVYGSFAVLTGWLFFWIWFSVVCFAPCCYLLFITNVFWTFSIDMSWFFAKSVYRLLMLDVLQLSLFVQCRCRCRHHGSKKLSICLQSAQFKFSSKLSKYLIVFAIFYTNQFDSAFQMWDYLHKTKFLSFVVQGVQRLVQLIHLVP